MARIAIVGTEGCGKTVFISTLAKRMSQDNFLGVFMNPLDRQTIQYVEHAWRQLNDHDWPPSTPPGQLFELGWTIGWKDGLAGDIRLVDCAGQDLRNLFAGDQDPAGGGPPPQLQRLSDYCLSADIVLLLVNLKDFIGEGDNERRVASEWAIKYAIDVRSGQTGRPAKLALVFTQADQYMEVFKECGNSLEVAKKYLPYVFGAHLRNGHVKLLTIASVTDTEPREVEPGKIIRVPKPGFRSYGLEKMVPWIGEQLKVIAEEDRQRELEKQRQAQQTALETQRQQWNAAAPERAKQNKQLLKWTLIGVGCLIALSLIVCNGFFSKPEVKFRWDIKYGTFFDDIVLYNDSEFAITHVALDVSLPSAGVRRPLYTPYIEAQSSYTWSNEISVPKGTTGTASLHCDQNRK